MRMDENTFLLLLKEQADAAHLPAQQQASIFQEQLDALQPNYKILGDCYRLVIGKAVIKDHCYQVLRG